VRRGLRIVSPYRPFAPESQSHELLGPFDWIGALRMLAVSVAQSNACETLALTDVATPLAVPALSYPTTQPRLMLWILEVTCWYLESADFDRDTILVSPDTLVFQDLRPYFSGDLTVLIRAGDRFAARPILNSVQWFPVRSKARLIAFYRDALAIGQTLDEGYLRWGADTEPLRQLLAPVVPGLSERHGLDVSMLHAQAVMNSLPSHLMQQLEAGHPIPWPRVPVVDFRYLRKIQMAAYFDATIGRAAQEAPPV